MSLNDSQTVKGGFGYVLASVPHGRKPYVPQSRGKWTGKKLISGCPIKESLLQDANHFRPVVDPDQD